jgi:hypothetical protein
MPYFGAKSPTTSIIKTPTMSGRILAGILGGVS